MTDANQQFVKKDVDLRERSLSEAKEGGGAGSFSQLAK